MLGAPNYDACYRALDLEPGATEEQIDDSWKLLVSAWHPDKFADALKEKATRRLQEINNARDELNRYWRRYGAPPPTVGGFRPRATSAPASEAWGQPASEAAAPARAKASRSYIPARWRRPIFHAIKWLMVCAVVWLFWRPIHWQGETTIVQLVFWVMLLGGSAQLVEAVAKAWRRGPQARRRRSRA
jgi:uncharacterized membrane protein YccC